jgi:hypothetical protein
VIDLPQPTGAELWPTEAQTEPARLHRPWRALVALGEVIVAAVLVWLAFLVWHSGVVPVTTVLTDGTRLVSSRFFGGPIAGALGMGLLAALILVDAVRQLLLAIRAGHRRSRKTR